ncbi:hypothetical protein ANCDUO_25435 [Ancylostoma duodenale]|uniref:Zinc knuckle n=1 Tax=Ancylostoma duodenale TaxID=51022 RepID=A0A0C2FCU3_9BILA|nr:hypothetical protein ANCDUO_25435 [Ancylostoma duodenale]
MNAYEELTQNKRSRTLRRIHNAIPTLPTPVVVYNKIIHGSVTLQVTARSMKNLRDRLKAVRTSDKGWQERPTQLETLFAVVPLLIATDAISKQQWDELVNRPQYDDVGKPVTVNQGKLELIISDQIDLLEEARLSILEMRQEFLEEERRETQRFQASVLASLKNLHDTVEKGFVNINQDSHETENAENLRLTIQQEIATLSAESAHLAEGIKVAIDDAIAKLSHTESRDITSTTRTESSTQNPSQEHSREGEGIVEEMHKERDEIPRLVGDDDSNDESEQMEEEERNIIRDNERFIEGLDAMEEEEEEEPEDEEALRLAARQIENEIHQTEQGVLDLEDIVNSLDQEQTCAPRNYERGAIQRDDERTLHCVYCGRIGDHYSDSCIAHRNIMERRVILDAQRRCRCCLEIEFSHHVCRKANLPCYHCRERGHHSSLCDFPERSEDIRNRIHHALESRRMALDRIRELQRELQELH